MMGTECCPKVGAQKSKCGQVTYGSVTMSFYVCIMYIYVCICKQPLLIIYVKLNIYTKYLEGYT